MSQLQQLKTTVNSIAQEAKKTGSNLAQFKTTFSGHMSAVQAAIGGSSQRKDAEVLSALQDAQKQVDAATQALENASRIAKTYADSL